MEKPTFKLVGQPCSQHGQYTFYKALRISGVRERIIALGDFFFVKIWQDSELVSIGELQLLWNDRVSDQTLVSLRLYFLPENTPDGRNGHGEHEVLAINEKVVVRADDLLTWLWDGASWSFGLRATWLGAQMPDRTQSLHSPVLDFTDIDKEKMAIEPDPTVPSVVVFSYPRYCRYRAVEARMSALGEAAGTAARSLAGYYPPSPDTRILYCRDTFEYPELEGHEFVCNQLAPRPRARARRPRRHQRRVSSQSRSGEEPSPERAPGPGAGPGSGAGLGAGGGAGGEHSPPALLPPQEEVAFIKTLRAFYRQRGETLKLPRGLRDSVSLLTLWRGARHPDTLTHDALRHVYDRYLLPYERHERKNRHKVDADLAANTQHVKPDVTDVKPVSTDVKPVSADVKPVSADVKHVAKSEVDDKCDAKAKFDTDSDKPKTSDVVKCQKSEVKCQRESKSDVKVKSVERNVPQDLVMVRDDKCDTGPQPPAAPAHVSNGHLDAAKSAAGRARSSLRSVRVKPGRHNHNTSNLSQPQPDSASSSPPAVNPPTPHTPHTHPLTHPHPPPPTQRPPPAHHVSSTDNNSDDEIVEVPYKPKTPEIIDLDDYPESPQSAKKRKLDILKERGLEVTAVPPTIWPVPLPNMAAPIIPFMVYNVPPYPDVKPPTVLQAKSIFGTASSGPEQTVYGHPKDPYMPPPHILRGGPIRPARNVTPIQTPAQDILDLTCSKSPGAVTNKPSVEIVRVPTTPSPRSTTPQNLSKNYTIVDGKAVVGSNLEITLVNKPSNMSTTPIKNRAPQKRSSNGKFVAKTPTPPKEQKPSPSGINKVSKPNIVVPNYQIREDPNSKDLLNMYKNYEQQSKSLLPPNIPLAEPGYMNALYSSLASQMDQRQLAFYRELMANQLRAYGGGLLNMGVATPTTKN